MNGKSDRLLAFNIRAARIGYVLFDGPKRLLDWGTRATSLNGMSREDRRTHIAPLIAQTSPSAIVICRARRKCDVDPRNALDIAALARREATLRSIPFEIVGVKRVQQVFVAFRAANKDEMAAAVARAYPEILWKLPPSRKRWQTEPRVMLVFDALTAGIAYWLRHDREIPDTNIGTSQSR